MNNQDTKNLLDHIHEKFHYSLKNILSELFKEFLIAYIADKNKSDTPIYKLVSFSSQGWTVNYYNRRHIFIYNPSITAVSLTSSDGLWNTSVNPKVWTNISYPDGTFFTANPSTVNMYIKCTNEQIP